MANPHRTNVLVTSCLKTPVDPHTKAPLASYERERVLPYSAMGHLDNRDYEKEVCDLGSDFCYDDYLGKEDPRMGGGHHRAAADYLDLSKIFFSNEEYYSKLEELKKAHLRTMAELESMYQQKLQLRSMDPLDMVIFTRSVSCKHNVSHSAVELRWISGQSDSSDENEAWSNTVEKGLLFSPKEYIKNMWKDFKIPSNSHRMSSSSLHSAPGDQRRLRRRRDKSEQEDGKPSVTVPKPFHMTLREAERLKRGVKTRSEVERENMELKRQLEELTECQKQFRASPVPAHVHLPVYEEMQERNKEQRRSMRDRETRHLRALQKPFSFLERERLKKEQKQLQQQQLQQADSEKIKPFKAKPVPKSVYAAASGDQVKENELYRSIKKYMRVQDLLRSSSEPPSMLTRRLNDRKKPKHEPGEGFTHKPQINREVPDFNASYRRFQKQLEKRKDVKTTTACEPFELKTSQISSHRERILADIEKDQSSPRLLRWPHISPGPARTPNSSLCSSLKALEQRKKAEEEEERWMEKQREREKKLQRMVLKRAQANDPHLALSQTNKSKLKEFRKQDIQRKREYRQEIREMRERVQGRPLLLEQVTQVNVSSTKQKHAHHLYEQKSDQASLSHRESEDASGHHGDGPHYSDESYNYSDDHENFSDDSEHEVDDRQQELID
uniref:Protein FAM161A n=1 Tax=Poecilia mexicana TaxID=48701 RepID=A0A3B3Y5L1_9TELE